MRALAFSGGKDSMACLHLMKDQLDCAIYVDTGYSYPETRQMVEYAKTFLPVHVIGTDRKGQNAHWGIPADVVPVNWTLPGQHVTTTKPVMVQSYMQCCWENISGPLLNAAIRLGVTELVTGQRNDEGHKALIRNGDVHDGITRVHPIEDWSTAKVLDYLDQVMPLVPPHYVLNHSSLDCYDCPAFAHETTDRVAWTAQHYPAFHVEHQARSQAIHQALQEATHG